MPLSEHEQRKLAEIEQDLLSADPNLAKNLREGPKPTRRRLVAAALFVSGQLAIIAAIMLAPNMIGVLLTVAILGSCLMFAGGLYAFIGTNPTKGQPKD